MVGFPMRRIVWARLQTVGRFITVSVVARQDFESSQRSTRPVMSLFVSSYQTLRRELGVDLFYDDFVA
jgi:hypothetical protein